jgi:hypothetical protein
VPVSLVGLLVLWRSALPQNRAKAALTAPIEE